jgi:hypothetical protein
MSKIHRVRQGEYLALIARNYGISSWQKIYNHPDNAAFKEKRPEPDLIYPDDEIVIPEIERRVEQCEVEARHIFKRVSETFQLHVRIEDYAGAAIPTTKYTLEFRDTKLEGTTSDVGVIDRQIPLGINRVRISIWEDAEASTPMLSWSLNVGDLDPIERTSGVQARLANMGIKCGRIDGVMGPQTRAAVKIFQKQNDLVVDGIVGPNTNKKLLARYGC